MPHINYGYWCQSVSASKPFLIGLENDPVVGPIRHESFLTEHHYGDAMHSEWTLIDNSKDISF